MGLALSAVAYMAVVAPYAAGTDACGQRIAELRRVLDQEAQVRRDHQRLTEQLRAARQQAAALKESIPDTPREADFLGELSRAAEQTGVTIQDYRPGVTTPQGNYSTIEVQLAAAGTYGDLCRFLDQLPRLPRHSTVTELAVESRPGSDHCSLTLGLQLYFAPTSRQSLAQRD